MASRRYRTYKFFYEDDLGNTVIKRQRSYLDSDNAELTPITALFLVRLANFPEKVTGTSQGLRHLLSFIGGGRFKANIPYRDSSEQRAHIEEILAVPRVDCGDYYGERNIKNGSSNSF